MADNVAITAGSGTTIATDDVGGVQYQKVKLDVGGDGASVPAVSGSGTATGALRVELPTNGTGVIATVEAVTAITNALPAGTNVIGKARLVDSAGDEVTDGTANAVKVLAVDSAGSALSGYVDRLTDNMGVALQTDKLLDDTTALTPKFKRASVAASQTDSSLIAAVTSKKLRVLAMRVMVGATATDSTFESDGGSDTILHEGTYGANGGEVLPFNPVGWFETVAGEALIVTTGSGSTTKYTIVYVEV